jgi:hypothetical protein
MDETVLQWAWRLPGFSVPGDEQLSRVAAMKLVAKTGRLAAAMLAQPAAQPAAECPGHLQGERVSALLAALAGAPDVRAKPRYTSARVSAESPETCNLVWMATASSA